MRHRSGRAVGCRGENLSRNTLRQHPDHPDALQMLGSLAGRCGDADAAIDLIRRAISAIPDYPGRIEISLRCCEQHRFDEAIAAYKRFSRASA